MGRVQSTNKYCHTNLAFVKTIKIYMKYKFLARFFCGKRMGSLFQSVGAIVAQFVIARPSTGDGASTGFCVGATAPGGGPRPLVPV